MSYYGLIRHCEVPECQFSFTIVPDKYCVDDRMYRVGKHKEVGNVHKNKESNLRPRRPPSPRSVHYYPAD